jgi:hypothetical protein
MVELLAAGIAVAAVLLLRRACRGDKYRAKTRKIDGRDAYRLGMPSGSAH